MNIVYYDKTEKGRLEISTRQFQLSSKLRPLLVIIDGKRTTPDIIKSVAGLGLNDKHLNELLTEGFITERIQEFVLESNLPPEIIVAPVAVAAAVAEPMPMVSPPISTTNIPDDKSLDDFEQRIVLKNFFNESVKSVLGLRGFGFQLKVERAETLADFAELRSDFLEAVYKAKGEDMAQSLRMQLDKLLQRDKT